MKYETSNSETSESELNKDQEFFCFPANKEKTENSSENELKMYLKSALKDITMLLSYPALIKTFLKYNTPLPSSAPVERLFSTGSNVMTTKRSRLNDELFEKLILLKQNKVTLDI